MIQEYQVTLTTKNGHYKPVSTIVKLEKGTPKKEIINAGVIKICQKRYWSKADLVKYTYLIAHVRVYDPEKIAQENAERYAKIKEEKYASEEWKRPKKDLEKA